MNATFYNTRLLRVSDLLRRVWPRDTAKLAASEAGLSVRTAQAWMSDRCSPSWDTVLRLAAKNDALRREIIQALQEPQNEPPLESVPASPPGECSDEFAGYPLGKLGA